MNSVNNTIWTLMVRKLCIFKKHFSLCNCASEQSAAWKNSLTSCWFCHICLSKSGNVYADRKSAHTVNTQKSKKKVLTYRNKWLQWGFSPYKCKGNSTESTFDNTRYLSLLTFSSKMYKSKAVFVYKFLMLNVRVYSVDSLFSLFYRCL